MAKVLIIDDEEGVRDSLTEMVRRMGHEADSAATRADGLSKALEGAPDVIFLDVYLPDGDGLALLPTLGKLPQRPEVIIMTGLGDAEGAAQAVRNGAWDYMCKPLSPRAILNPLRQVLEYRDQTRATPQGGVLRRAGLAGSSAAFLACLEQLAAAARSDAPVLLYGETGTGKERFARCLHDNSRRCEQPFVVVDCTNIPENLMESMLFGHERGAFTGAEQRRAGLIAEAHGGTLFLDEIGDLALPLQKKLLRVLQEKSFRRVGGVVEEQSDFRLVAATNRNLVGLVEQGAFRADLQYRVQALTITLPPLRHRVEDMEVLVEHLLGRLCQRYAMAPRALSSDFLPTLCGYHWPGNVRELNNALEQVLANAGDATTLFARHLPHSVRIASLQSQLKEPRPPSISLAEESRPQPPLAWNHRAGSACVPASGLAVGAASGSAWSPTVSVDAAPEPSPVSSPETGPETAPDEVPEACADIPLQRYKDYRKEALRHIDRVYFDQLLRFVEGDVGKACALSGLGRSRLYDMLRCCDLRLGDYQTRD